LFISHWYIFLITIAIAVGYYIYTIGNQVEGALAQLQISLKYNESNAKDYTDYSDEMTGINAPGIIEGTVESLHLDVSYFTKKNGSYTEVYNTLPFKITTALASPALQKSYFKFKILNENEYEISSEQVNSTELQHGFFDSATVSTDLKLIAEKTQADTALKACIGNEYYFQVHDKASLVNKYQSLLSTKLTKDLAVLQVTYRDIFPKRAVAFLDTLARVYLNNTIKTQIDRNVKMVTGIDKLMLGTEGVLKGIEDSLRFYSLKSGIVDENIQGQKYISELTNLMLDKRKLEMQRIVLGDLEKYIVENKNTKGLPPPYFGGTDDPFLRSSLAELYNLQLDKKESLFDATEKNPNINKLDKNYETRKADLLKYIQNGQKMLDEKILYFKNQLADIDDPAKNGNKSFTKEQLYIMDLKRQLSVNEKMYMNLLEKRNNILIAQAAMAPEYKIFESAHIIQYAPPADIGMLYFYITIALLFALAIIYVKNFFFEEIETLEYLKTKTKIPILGEMPFIELNNDKSNTILDTHNHPLGAPLLSSIRTNLEFELAGKKSKVVLITSHNSSEGKTFNAVNLGAILAKAKKRVLIIDMDFHKPNLANVLGLKTNELTTISEVYDNAIDVSNAITNTRVVGLDAMINKSYVEDASEKILSNITKKIIDFAKKNYDYVIIDTPPVGIISDALTLMKYTSLSIYILNAIVPYKNSLTQVDEIIEKNQFKIHLILNKVKVKRLQYYSKQYYNYRYAKAS